MKGKLEITDQSPHWEEELSERQTGYDYFGVDPEGPFDENFFDGDEFRIPSDIGDAFRYKADLGAFKALFSQEYKNTIPLSTVQSLYFSFPNDSQVTKSDENPLSGLEGFDFLKGAVASFKRGRYEDGRFFMNLISQNLGLSNNPEGFAKEKTLTKRGHQFISAVLATRQKFLNMKGMNPNETLLLGELFQSIEEAHNSEDLFLSHPLDSV